MPRILLLFCFLVLTSISPRVAAAEDLSPQRRQEVRTELTGLLSNLDSDRYEVRQGASVKLEEMAARPELGAFLSAEFQSVLARLDTSFEVRWHLKRLTARLPEAAPQPVAELSDEQIAELIGKLGDDSYTVRLGVTRQLKGLLFRDEYVPRVKTALKAELKRCEEAETILRIKKLLKPFRPAMVAEYWQGRRHLGEQHLIVGVPSQTLNAPRPSHFDRIDDKVAHCVSGVNLSEGEYPVGVAFPHPKQPGAFFHLVNLPTPQRRSQYKRHVETDEAKRLAAISRRTLDRMLSESRELSEAELLMLPQLDPKEVSRFAGQYFLLVEDKPLPVGNTAMDRPSRFGMICRQLAVDGAKEAAPGLLKAIDEGSFLPPTSDAPYHLHWIAALAIANRDPWPEADRWLAGLIGRDDPLVEGYENGPQLGATAAGVLLRRHQGSAKELGLLSVVTPQLARWPIHAYRFPSTEVRDKVQQWWAEKQEPPK